MYAKILYYFSIEFDVEVLDLSFGNHQHVCPLVAVTLPTTEHLTIHPTLRPIWFTVRHFVFQNIVYNFLLRPLHLDINIDSGTRNLYQVQHLVFNELWIELVYFGKEYLFEPWYSWFLVIVSEICGNSHGIFEK